MRVGVLLFTLVLVTSVLSAEECPTQGWNTDSSWKPQPQQLQFSPGDLRNCLLFWKLMQNEAQTIGQLKLLPGGGFDNLRNLDMAQVHKHDYKFCQLTHDNKYVIPDTAHVIPIEESEVESTADVFTHWDNTTSMTASSINIDVHGGIPLIYYKYSKDYLYHKRHQVSNSKTRVVSTRIQIRHHFYTIKLNPDVQLHPSFKSRLFDIAANLLNNNTDYAHYLAELLVSDYGTHYVTSIDTGAIIAQSDFFLNSSKVTITDNDIKAILTYGKQIFFNLIKANIGVSFSDDSTKTEGFEFEHSHSKVTTLGGPPFNSSTTLAEWEKGVPDNLVAIDRSGEPLHFAINQKTIPELPETTVRAVSNIVQKAIHRYYKVNTRYGCTDPISENFNFQANIDDGSCKPPNTNFTFGGVFQECSVDYSTNGTENLCTSGANPASQTNPLTGDYSCPQHYTAVKIHSGTVTHVLQKKVCTRHRCHWLLHCTSCTIEYHLSQANYDAYWCVALPGTTVPQESGYLFGGAYTSTDANPLTGAMSCPTLFFPLHIGEYIKVCVSTEYHLGSTYAFGGFESCIVGNPLAAAPSHTGIDSMQYWPHACPHGYMHHLIAVDEDCEINACIYAGAYKTKSLLPIRLPPFRSGSKIKNNLTNTLVIFGVRGDIWTKDENGQWVQELDGSEMTGKDFLAMSVINTTDSTPAPSTGSGHHSNAVIVTASVMGTLILGLCIALTFVGWRAYSSKKGGKVIHQRTEYMQINDPPGNSSQATSETVA